MGCRAPHAHVKSMPLIPPVPAAVPLRFLACRVPCSPPPPPRPLACSSCTQTSAWVSLMLPLICARLVGSSPALLHSYRLPDSASPVSPRLHPSPPPLPGRPLPPLQRYLGACLNPPLIVLEYCSRRSLDTLLAAGLRDPKVRWWACSLVPASSCLAPAWPLMPLPLQAPHMSLRCVGAGAKGADVGPPPANGDGGSHRHTLPPHPPARGRAPRHQKFEPGE